MRRALLFPALFLVIAALGAACQGLIPVPVCDKIPAGGCPVMGGGTCDDATCNAIFDCTADGVWTHVQTCPPRTDAGTGSGGGGGGFPADAGPCTPIVLDVDAGPLGQGCPDLEDPDCPIEAASCQETACLTGCSDFYVCSQDGVWVVVASCDDSGNFVPMQ